MAAGDRTLTCSIVGQIVGNYVREMELGGNSPGAFSRAYTFDWTTGTGTDQADRLFRDERSTDATGEVLDLAGGLTDDYGQTLTFVEVKFFALYNLDGTASFIIGNTAANQFVGWFGAAAHTEAVKPLGLTMHVAPKDAAWTVTAGTGDNLLIKTSSGSANYQLWIVGTTA